MYSWLKIFAKKFLDLKAEVLHRLTSRVVEVEPVHE